MAKKEVKFNVKIKNEWRTPTVLQLCESIRVTQDYSVAPILADALQDADCDDEEILKTLRDSSERSVFLVACIYNEKNAEAIKWVEDYASNFRMNGTRILQAADHYQKTNQSHCLGDDTPDVAWSEAETFWKHYQSITGKPVKEGSESDCFFRCAC
jgi:ribosome-binding factor A